MNLIDNLTEWFDKISAYGSGIKARSSQSMAGELSPASSRRNREIFERLTGSEDTAREAPEPQRAVFSPPVTESVRDNVTTTSFEATTQKLESFSLERGVFQSRETVVAPDFEPPAGVEFPALSKAVARTGNNALENLYHDLEVEARRTSQLICEEEIG